MRRSSFDERPEFAERPAGAFRRKQRLGPDLLAEEFDYEDACRRLRERNDLPMGVALRMQSALAGVGNVYKSETWFLCQTSPFATVRDLSDHDGSGNTSSRK